MQFDLVRSGEARPMIDQPREQMAASGTKPTWPVLVGEVRSWGRTEVGFPGRQVRC